MGRADGAGELLLQDEGVGHHQVIDIRVEVRLRTWVAVYGDGESHRVLALEGRGEGGRRHCRHLHHLFVHRAAVNHQQRSHLNRPRDGTASRVGNRAGHAVERVSCACFGETVIVWFA